MAVLLTYCVQLGLFPVLWCLTVWLYKFNSSNFLIHVSSCFPLNSMVGLIVNFRIVVGKRRVVKIISLERKFAVSFLTCLCICCSVAQSLWFFVTPWTTGVTRSLKSLLQHHWDFPKSLISISFFINNFIWVISLSFHILSWRVRKNQATLATLCLETASAKYLISFLASSNFHKTQHEHNSVLCHFRRTSFPPLFNKMFLVSS